MAAAAHVPAYARNLDADQEGKVARLEAAVHDAVSTSASHRAFCTRATYVRYLKARGWSVSKAAKMLLATLAWRAEFQPEALTWDSIKHEARGNLYIFEKPDLSGRPVVLMRPRCGAGPYTAESAVDRIKWLVYQLEAASALADASEAPGADGKMAWLIDFQGYSRKNSPPVRVGMQTLHILQNHYPERLGKAVSYKPPMLFDLLWTAVGPFVDPVTRDKLVFLHSRALRKQPDAMAKHFDMGQLDDSMGGQIPEAQIWDISAYEQRMRVMDSQAAARVAAAAAAVGAPESPTHLQAALSQLSSAGLEDKAAEQAEEDAAAVVAAGVPGLESGSGETPRSSGGSDGAASSEADAVTACSRLSQDLRDEEAATAIAGLALQQNGASEVAAAAGGTR